MNKKIDFAPHDKIKDRNELCLEFYQNILQEDEWPLLVTDESSIYDFTFDDDDLLISKISKYYGVKILPSDLKKPFWKLLDLINNTKFNCPCCNYKTLNEKPTGTFQICSVCYWEDDNIQFENPDFEGGANDVSLNIAKENFKKIGAIEERYLSRVRSPFDDEK